MLNVPQPQTPAIPVFPAADFEEFFFDFPGAAKQIAEQSTPHLNA